MASILTIVHLKKCTFTSFQPTTSSKSSINTLKSKYGNKHELLVRLVTVTYQASVTKKN